VIMTAARSAGGGNQRAPFNRRGMGGVAWRINNACAYGENGVGQLQA